MTKQELIKMTGSEEQADFAMEILLKNCKKAFVEMAIKAELNEIEKEVKAFEEEGILSRYNSTWHVNWAAPHRVFGDEPLGCTAQGFRRRAGSRLARDRRTAGRVGSDREALLRR